MWVLFYGKHIGEYKVSLAKRVVAAYLVTLLVALALLVLIDKGPLNDLPLALRWAVLIAFPASFPATAVDYIK